MKSMIKIIKEKITPEVKNNILSSVCLYGFGLFVVLMINEKTKNDVAKMIKLYSKKVNSNILY